MKIKTKHIKLVAFRAVLVLVCVSLVACAVRNNSYATDNDNYDPVFEDGKPIYIKNDGSMIPDIYNTGYDPNIELEPVVTGNGDFYVDGLKFRDRPDMGVGQVVLDTADVYTGEETVIEVRNKDFTGITINQMNYHAGFGDNGEKVIVKFYNCKFTNFAGARVSNPAMEFEFYDCEFEGISGSYITVERAKIHGSSGDAINPFRFFTMKDSYIYHVGTKDSGDTHIDGFQVYGNANYDVDQILFSNVRFELPKHRIKVNETEYAIGLVNAPVMIQIEFSANASNITVENSHYNGGGYSSYIHCVKDCQSLTNVTFKNNTVGYGHMFGKIYPNHENTDAASIASVEANSNYVTSLYVGSAWKSSTGVHMSVTNELRSERTMQCVSDKGTINRTIVAHPTITQHMAAEDVPEYEDFPYDLDVIVADATATSVDCYDITDDTNLQTAPKIRSVRFAGSENPTTPTEPTTSTDPTTPTEPTGPTEPAGPTNPTEPTTPAETPAEVSNDTMTIPNTGYNTKEVTPKAKADNTTIYIAIAVDIVLFAFSLAVPTIKKKLRCSILGVF